MRKFLLVCFSATLILTGAVLSGCLISPPESPTLIANIITLKPSYLETLPDGLMYEGWLVTGDTVELAWQVCDTCQWVSFARFNWDTYAYQPTDADGNHIINRFDAGVDVFDYDRIFITIEGIPGATKPIVIMQGDVDQMNGDADLEHPVSTADVSDFNPENFFWIYSQSDQSEDGWYDTLTGDLGIWFGEISMDDLIEFDSLCYDSASEDWYECPEGQGPDSLRFCFDSLGVIIDCSEPHSRDSVYFDVLVVVTPMGDTMMAPSLETLPAIVEGWKYESWIIFTEGSGRSPLSMGKFTSAERADDDTSYSLQATYDRNFAIPGEDFLRNVPGSSDGKLHVVNDPTVDRIYITVEPDPDFDENNPFLQMIMFSAPIPDPDKFYTPFLGELTQSPISRRWRMWLRDLTNDLHGDHHWPLMHVDFEREQIR